MDLATMRALVRCDLHDQDVQSYRWTNAELDRHIGRAVKEFSLGCPLEQKAVIATTIGSREVSVEELPDLVSILAVEYPLDRLPRCLLRFSLFQETITFLEAVAPQGDNCRVYYGGLHTLDTEGSTVPACYEDLVAGGAAAYAALEWAVHSVDRVNAGGDQVAAGFLTWAQARSDKFQAGLKRLKSRVRTGALYTEE